MSFITAAIIGAVATAGATAYSSKQARKAQKKAREDQQLRDLIEGAAPNISAVEEIIAEEIGQQDAALLDDALKQMDYQTQQAQEGADFAAQAQADQMLQQALTEEEALQLLQQQGGIAGMARGGPIGTPNDTYYFSVPQVMQMMKDPNPQIQGVGMQLADQMTSTPGMSMVSATPDQIRGMAYGGQVEPKKLADGSDGGLRGYLSMNEMPEDATDYDKRMQLQLIANEMQRNAANSDGFITSSTRDDIELIEHPETGDLIPVIKGQEYYGPMTSPREDKLSPDRIEEILEMVRASKRHLSDKDREMLGLPMAAGGPVRPKKYADGDVVEDPMNQVIRDLLANQIPGVSQVRALKDVKEAEGLEKLVEALDLAPINPVKLGRGMKERIEARRAARRAAEEEAESRVFGPR
jgi:hypothetical protein